MSNPTRQALSTLYTNTLRTSSQFSSYNFRNYFLRRTNDVFKPMEKEEDLNKVSEFVKEKEKELEVLKRAVVVNQMFGGRRLVVEEGEGLGTPDKVMERSDN